MAHARPDPGRDPAPPPVGRALALWLAAAPAIALAAAALLGAGLLRGLSPVAGLVGAAALLVLPAAGLASLRPGRPGTAPLAAGAWSLAVLLAMPAYWPGERAAAVDRGVRALAAPIGDERADALAGTLAAAVDLLGEDRPTAAPRPAAPAAAAAPDGDEPARAARAAPPDPPAGPARRTAGVILPYRGDATSLRVEVDFDGPEVGERLEMIFDTGATFTTLDRAHVARLGVDVGPDAPWITLRTANGEIEAPLVLVDAVWLGDEPVEWVTVAVCDSCASPPVAGLLGLNVTGRFRVALDHDRRRIELAPRRRARDSGLDVGQWLEVRSRATQTWTGAVDVALTAHNRSRRTIEEAVVDLSCGEQTFAIQIDDIPAHGERTTEIALPRGTDCRHQSLTVSRGRWMLDRFPVGLAGS